MGNIVCAFILIIIQELAFTVKARFSASRVRNVGSYVRVVQGVGFKIQCAIARVGSNPTASNFPCSFFFLTGSNKQKKQYGIDAGLVHHSSFVLWMSHFDHFLRDTISMRPTRVRSTTRTAASTGVGVRRRMVDTFRYDRHRLGEGLARSARCGPWCRHHSLLRVVGGVLVLEA